MMSILMEQLINITDAIFLGHVGEVELGASALAGIYYLAVYMLGFGFSVGLQVVVARRNGEQKYEETGKTFFQGLFFLLALALCLCLLVHWFSPFILKRLITSPEVYRAVVQYLDWRSLGMLVSFPFLAFRSFFAGITKTKPLLWAAITAVCINIPLNYGLIFRLDFGIAGAAMASSLAEAASFIVLFLYMWLKVDKRSFGLKAVYDGRLLMNLLRISIWSMLHAFISIAPWFLFFVVIEHLGKTELAISNITRSISTIFFVIVSSFAATTGSLVSNAIGAGQWQLLFPICRKVLKLGYAIGLPLVVLALLGNRFIIGFYTDNDALIQQAVIPFVVMLLNYVLAMPGCVYINAVTGTGKTKVAFAFQVTTIFVYLLYLYWISHCLHAPLAVYLTAEYVFVAMQAIQSIIYLKRRFFLILSLDSYLRVWLIFAS